MTILEALKAEDSDLTLNGLAGKKLYFDFSSKEWVVIQHKRGMKELYRGLDEEFAVKYLNEE